MLYNEDCLEKMKILIKEGFKADAIITDPPYLYLKNKLDKQFNEELFFEMAGKITDKIVFFGRGDSFYKWNLLANENKFLFKEEVIWNKKYISNPTNSFLRRHELISVRMKKGYKLNKVYISRIRKLINEDKIDTFRKDLNVLKNKLNEDSVLYRYVKHEELFFINVKRKFKLTTSIKKSLDRSVNLYNAYNKGNILSSIISIPREHYKTFHPTQKPIELMRLLIKLVSNENDLIFDPFMGGGSTGVSAILENRNFMGCEIDKEYFDIAKKRIDEMRETIKLN